MGANPISYREIDAYRRMTLTPLSAWDVRLINRLDRAVLPILSPAPTSNTVSARDGNAVLAMVRGQAARHKAQPQP